MLTTEQEEPFLERFLLATCAGTSAGDLCKWMNENQNEIKQELEKAAAYDALMEKLEPLIEARRKVCKKNAKGCWSVPCHMKGECKHFQIFATLAANTIPKIKDKIYEKLDYQETWRGARSFA